MSSNMGTREKLLSIIDDMEIIAKTFLDHIVTPKSSHLSDIDLNSLAELFVLKDQDFKTTLKIAEEQAEIQKKINVLQIKVDRQDQDIHQLQKYLKEAEHLLATAIYQAKQKMVGISKANEKSVSTEELIKYAHRISACNAVAAPHNWQPGDNRRPYPTDIEMRLGYLGRLSDLPVTGNVLQPQGNLSELSTSRGPHGETPSQATTFTWQASSDIKPQISTSTNHCVSIDTKNHGKENEEVEVMSTDSSSSSSSDSQ